MIIVQNANEERGDEANIFSKYNEMNCWNWYRIKLVIKSICFLCS